jgi:hypothetical protein
MMKMMLHLILAAGLGGPGTGDGPSAAHRACGGRGRSVGDETVHVPWTRVRTVGENIGVHYCVMRGRVDASFPFLRDAEHVYFTLSRPGPGTVETTLLFTVQTSTGRIVQLGPSRIRVAPWEQPSCRIEVCQMFTEPGERIGAVDVKVVPMEPPAWKWKLRAGSQVDTNRR